MGMQESDRRMQNENSAVRCKTLKIFFSFLVIILSLSESNSADRVRASTVHYTSGKDSVSAYLAVPEGKGPFAAVVVIHEWWGLNEWVRETAKKIASDGYVTLAVDLYRGKVADSSDAAHELMRGLPEDRAARDLVAAVEFLRSRPDVNPKKIGSIGWCMGGGYSLTAALSVPDLAACIICYGRLVTDSSSIEKIRCPILGIFGEEDRGIPPESVREFEAACKKADKSIEVQIYKGAGHAFLNPNNKKGFREEAAKNAWGRINSFLARILKK